MITGFNSGIDHGGFNFASMGREESSLHLWLDGVLERDGVQFQVEVCHFKDFSIR